MNPETYQRLRSIFLRPAASWLNLVERFFWDLTQQGIRSRRFSESSGSFVEAIEAYLAHHNVRAKRCVWRAAAEVRRNINKASIAEPAGLDMLFQGQSTAFSRCYASRLSFFFAAPVPRQPVELLLQTEFLYLKSQPPIFMAPAFRSSNHLPDDCIRNDHVSDLDRLAKTRLFVAGRGNRPKTTGPDLYLPAANFSLSKKKPAVAEPEFTPLDLSYMTR